MTHQPSRLLRCLRLLAGAAVLPVAIAAASLPMQAAAATPTATQTAAKPAAKSAAAKPAAKKASKKAGTAKKPAAKKKSVSQKKSVSKKKSKSRKTRRSTRRYAPAPLSTGTRLGLHRTRDELALKSGAALVIDMDTGETLTAKNADVRLPVASLTKLMTALVVMDAKQDLEEVLQIGQEDVDTEKNTHSRLKVGTWLTRDEMLLLALMSSENRAAQSLSRHYPGGRGAFLAAMNAKAHALGMNSTHFADAAGLNTQSVSTARDLHKLVAAAEKHELIRDYSTREDAEILVGKQRLKFISSNRLVRSASDDWDIDLQKTGFTNEAGRCLIMQATVLGRRLAMIFLDSAGTLTRYADAVRVRKRVLEREIEKDLRPSPNPASVMATPS